MAQDKRVEILKKALFLERRGRAFYETVANQAQGATVKRFFAMMAAEETSHIEALTTHFKSVSETSQFKAMKYTPKTDQDVAAAVLTKSIRKEISAAGYEAAAISAAMSMEQAAVILYAEQAAKATDAEEKRLYEWLASWERTHLDFLATIDNELREEIWYDNKFWPM
ncbi:MAG: ferritin family protein [Chitinivibrionales bacterium]|nr:ferritin family protein [Chitinivibrionales bacterium]